MQKTHTHTVTHAYQLSPDAYHTHLTAVLLLCSYTKILIRRLSFGWQCDKHTAPNPMYGTIEIWVRSGGVRQWERRKLLWKHPSSVYLRGCVSMTRRWNCAYAILKIQPSIRLNMHISRACNLYSTIFVTILCSFALIHTARWLPSSTTAYKIGWWCALLRLRRNWPHQMKKIKSMGSI